MTARLALVTGSEGFVGRHFSRTLSDQGWDVWGMDTVHAHASADVRDLAHEEFSWVQGLPRFDLVVHAAALVGGRARIEGDPLSLAVNLEIDAALFRWAARTEPGRVVYFSSSAAYPVNWQTEQSHFPLHENALTFADPYYVGVPDGTYGWAKVTGEYLATHLRDADVPVTVIRPFSGYGTDQSLDYPFPTFIKRALDGQRPFEIWGSGNQVRDWVHIDDIVGLTLAAVEQGLDGPFNACTGRPTSFVELANLVVAERWRPFVDDAYQYALNWEYEVQPDRPAGVFYRVGDPTLSHQVYAPRVTLEEGIRRALDGRL